MIVGHIRTVERCSPQTVFEYVVDVPHDARSHLGCGLRHVRDPRK